MNALDSFREHWEKFKKWFLDWLNGPRQLDDIFEPFPHEGEKIKDTWKSWMDKEKSKNS